MIPVDVSISPLNKHQKDPSFVASMASLAEGSRLKK
jgi:hypothetical protein